MEYLNLSGEFESLLDCDEDIEDMLKGGFYPLYVKSVTESPDRETYGFTIQNGTYVTNGIVSHNTPLVHYSLTPLEFIERKSAYKSYLGERWLTDEWYQTFKEHQVSFKVNGFRHSTFIEQSIVDLGRSLTPLIYKHFIKDSVPIYSLRTIATDEFIKDLKGFIDPKTHFADRDPETYISPCHRIHIELMGSYIPRARRLVRYKKEGRILENPEDIRCLKTYDEAKTHCKHACIVDDPLKVYHDVYIDEEGNKQGEYRLLKGCERCATPPTKAGKA